MFNEQQSGSVNAESVDWASDVGAIAAAPTEGQLAERNS